MSGLPFLLQNKRDSPGSQLLGEGNVKASNETIAQSLLNTKHLNCASLPTPIHRLNRLSEELGVDLHIKRDDVTDFILGGNKVRKLNFLFQEALDKGSTCVITCGGIQSNHCRAVAALAARLGLDCVLLLAGQPQVIQGNLLLSHLFSAEIHYVSKEEYEEKSLLLRKLASQVRDRGGKPYIIPEGGSNTLGMMGYIHMWQELEAQLGTEDIPKSFDSIVSATGSGGTQGGLILGKMGSKSPIATMRVVGVNVCYDKKKTFQLIKDLLWKSITQNQWPYSFLHSDIDLLDGFIGKGYGKTTPEELRFIHKVARTEGVLLDPTYSGKAFLGLYETLKKDKHAFGKSILFLHTGGAFANFIHEREWQEIVG